MRYFPLLGLILLTLGCGQAPQNSTGPGKATPQNNASPATAPKVEAPAQALVYEIGVEGMT